MVQKFNQPGFTRLGLLAGIAIAACLGGASHSAAYGQKWNPDPALGAAGQRRHLYDIARRYCESIYDPQVNMVGQKRHSSRESAFYAYGLLLTGDQADGQRAQAILRQVVSTQDIQAQSPTYGVYRWNLEDPRPQDVNSVAFVGLTLAQIIDLDRRRPALEPDLRVQLETSVRLAVQSAMARNVNADYTNIALLTVALTAAGNKLLAMPGAGAFAESKLDAVMALAAGREFCEYLSPTYAGTSLQGAYLARHFARTETLAAKADATINQMWKQIAAAYHAPTYQLAGPHLRSYGDNMLEYAAILKYLLYLALDGHYPLPDADSDHSWDQACVFTIAALPVSPREEFQKTPAPWREWQVTSSGSSLVRTLRQYRERDLILGTVDQQDEWKQKRNLVAYWRNDAGHAQEPRVGYCIDESNETLPKDFPGGSIRFFSQQDKSAALVMLATQHEVPAEASLSLVLDREAKPVDEGSVAPLRVRSGTMMIYLYPVTNNSSAAFRWSSDGRTPRLVRAWADADSVGSTRILAYLVIFRSAEQTAPVVSDIALTAADKGPAAQATVDGVRLKVAAD